MTVLVTGATGNVGSHVVRELQRRDVPVRAFVRDPQHAHERLGAVEVAVGDFSDPPSIRRALRGVDRVFLSSADGPQKVEHEAAVVDAAAAAGVELVVKASTMNAQAGSPLKPFDWNGRSEDHLRSSGVPAVILASAFYMTNLLALAEPVRHQGILPAPAGDGAIGMIDARDIAAVAATVLAADGGHAGRTYRLTGPEPVTYARVAEELGRAIGTPVRYVDVPPEAARQDLEATGMPDWLIEHLDEAFALIRAGKLDQTTDVVHTLTGREPRDIAAFASEVFAPLTATAPDGAAAADGIAPWEDTRSRAS
jgi:uncharacterized protein YbjT (DUF2867 family)